MTEKKRRSSSMTLRFFGLTVALLLFFGLGVNSYAALPGFVRTEAPLVSPKQAAEILVPMAPEVEPQGIKPMGAAGIDASSASSELAALAAIGHLLGSAGIPAQTYVYQDGSVAYVDIAHVWVQATINGSPFVFDPSLKVGSRTGGIDLMAATGYSRTSFLNNALDGASTSATPDSIQNINYGNIAADLSTYATSLVSNLKSNYTGARMKDVIGGLEIAPAAEHLRQTVHPDQTSVPTVWADIPVAYKTTLGILCPGINESLCTADIYARRLTLFFNESTQPVLRLNGTQLATGSSLTPGSSVTVTLSVDHPYAANGGTYCDDSRPVHISAGGSYVVVNGWGETARGTVERHRSALQAALRGLKIKLPGPLPFITICLVCVARMTRPTLTCLYVW